MFGHSTLIQAGHVCWVLFFKQILQVFFIGLDIALTVVICAKLQKEDNINKGICYNNPLAGKYPKRVMPNLPTKITNQQIWANHSTRYRPIQVTSQSPPMFGPLRGGLVKHGRLPPPPPSNPQGSRGLPPTSPPVFSPRRCRK